MSSNADAAIQSEAMRNGDESPKRWLTKAQAMAALGLSERTIENLIAKRELGSRPEPRKGMRPLTMVDGDDVERVFAERNKGAILRTQTEQTLIGQPVSPVQSNELLALALRKLLKDNEKPTARPWLTLAEAAEYTGLPETFLRRVAPTFIPGAVNVGSGKRNKRWMFQRAALDAAAYFDAPEEEETTP